jgi:hypothetical protein
MTDRKRRYFLAGIVAGLLVLMLLLLLAPATPAPRPRRTGTVDPDSPRAAGGDLGGTPAGISRAPGGADVWLPTDLFTGRGSAEAGRRSAPTAGGSTRLGAARTQTVPWGRPPRKRDRERTRSLIAVRPGGETANGDDPPVISAYSPGSDLVITAGESLRFEADCWEPGGGDLICDWRVDGRPAPSVGAVLEFTPDAAPGGHLVELAVCGPGGTASICWLLEPTAAEEADYPPIVRGSVEGIACDDSGNRYLVGYFTGTGVDFDPTSGADEHDSVGLEDVFVTRFDANGDYAWTKTFGGTGADYGTDLVVYGSVVYVVGYFNSTNADFGVTGSITTDGGNDCFLLALDAATGAADTAFSTDGVEVFGGSGDEYAYGVAADDGVVYVAGVLTSTDASVGNGAGSIAPAGGTDCFVLALDSTDGSAETGFSTDAVQTFGGSTDDEGWGVAVSGSVVYVTGRFTGSDAGIGGTGSVQSSGSGDCFVVALSDTDGSAVTAFDTDGVQIFGGANDDLGRDIVAYGSNVYVTGEFNSSDAGIGGTGGVSTAGGADCFVLALKIADGASDGVQTFGGTGADSGFSTAAGGGAVYAVGRFDSDDAGIGGAAGVDAEGTDCFVMALATSSNASGLQLFGGTSYDEGTGVAVYGGSVIFCGNTQSSNARQNASGPTYDGSSWGGFMLRTQTFDPGGDDDDGGSGCALAGGADPAAWLLPYVGLAVVWLLGRRRKR